MKREDILRRPAYWFEHEQNELYTQVTDYMERENINRTELASMLNVSKGYITQLLKGNYNYTLKKWIELCLAIGIVPGEYRKLEDIIQEDFEFAKAKRENRLEGKTEFEIDVPVYAIRKEQPKLRVIIGNTNFEPSYSQELSA
ncbi:helix-turn-helix transcriptional regulator [Mucilaginibacter sp.]|uniref:helix-turn-helix domain-containing protein n=1 Tax=Mucilaginibacter sp. TaxID=1882438 RepID=UPI00285135BA|nr:helix-turn-helix transcriptional regulator [Mucilaginibacter sp.]MDR3693518.1 helix-turn-helix transcriptional regulator [Mucilaginibacter sp.]